MKSASEEEADLLPGVTFQIHVVSGLHSLPNASSTFVVTSNTKIGDILRWFLVQNKVEAKLDYQLKDHLGIVLKKNDTCRSAVILENDTLYLCVGTGRDESSVFTTRTDKTALIAAVVAVVLLCAFMPYIISLGFPGSGDGGADSFDYGVVYDAGSVHTTVAVYEWPSAKLNGTGVVREAMSCEIPVAKGISSFSTQPADVKQYILDGTCLPKVLSTVPEEKRAKTPVFLGGTAGMRVLNATDAVTASYIIGNLSEALASTPFNHSEPTADIVSGSTEGLLGWVTSNYLSNVFGTDGSREKLCSPLGALDWGGASSQITFEVVDSVRAKQSALHDLTLYGKKYKVFTMSHLCYGQAEALRRYFVELVYEHFADGILPTVMRAPCQPKGLAGSYTVKAKDLFYSPCTKYKDERFQAAVEKMSLNTTIRFVGQSDLAACNREVEKSFHLDACRSKYANSEYCFDPMDIPRPVPHTKFLAFSTYWYLLDALKLNGANESTDADGFNRYMSKFCSFPVTQTLFLKRLGSDVQHNTCFKGLFMHKLLTEGYRFDRWDDISFVKRVSHAEVGWALGFMINRTNTL